MATASKKTWTINVLPETGEVKFTTKADGELRQTFNVNDLPREIQLMLAPTGLRALFAERNSDVPSAAVQAMMDSRQATWDHLVQGEWRAERTRGPRKENLEIQALALMHGISQTAVKGLLEAKTKIEIQALFESEAVQDKIREMEENAAGLDLTA